MMRTLPSHDAPGRVALPVKDKIIIGLIVFFTAVALTIEAYWLIFNQEMESRTDLFARARAFTGRRTTPIASPAIRSRNRSRLRSRR